MWLRDLLPRALPHARIILYGHDISHRNPVQSITDLSLDLIGHLRANGWTAISSKPVVFIAHSLGGLVLKQALVTLANSCDTRGNRILENTRGAVLFGVPSSGMEEARLSPMVDGGLSDALANDLAPESEYLQTLESQFSGISYLLRLRLYFAYETRRSLTFQVPLSLQSV